jgi:hypothetical protein
MKVIYIISFLLACFLFESCGEDNSPIKNGNAEVVINVATRGSYQFLIKFEDNLYFPENLPEEYKTIVQNPIPIFVKFTLIDREEDIFKPAPNDVPVFYKSLPVIRIINIRSLD